jgi:methyl-accepting chemotaxis protein
MKRNPFIQSLHYFTTGRGIQNSIRMDRFLVALFWLHFPAGLLVNLAYGREEWFHVIWEGILIPLVPTLAVLVLPRGSLWTRMLNGIIGMMLSGWLIHLSGGTIEFHFHVFVTLAVLSCYRDYRVLWPAAAFIAVHHIVMNFIAPTELFHYGPNFHMVLLHATFVILETAYLTYDIFVKSDEYDFVVSTQRLSEQVSYSSTQVVESSTALSQTISEQSRSMEMVAQTMTELDAQSRSNGENVTKANQFMAKAKAEVSQGSGQITRLVSSMDELVQDSNNMVGILKIIDSIAFQTNLLALNAAVEAARAGDTGKGFAVVAEEVRNLAGRSAEAARNIGGLIDTSLGKVKQGNTMAQETSKTFTEILNSVIKAESTLQEISEASRQHSQGTAEISKALAEMERTNQNNTTHASASAEAASALSNEVMHLKEILAGFTADNTVRNGSSNGGGAAFAASTSGQARPRLPYSA